MNATQQGGKVARSLATRAMRPDDDPRNPDGSDDCLHAARARRKSKAKLGWILKYENSALVARITKEMKCSEEEAIILFQDMLRFLWLSEQAGRISPSPRIDEAWHTFILFTMDYQRFCSKYFGHFIHHRPNRPEDPPDNGRGRKRTLEAIQKHFGGFEKLSANWKYGEEGHKCCLFICGQGLCRDTCDRDP